MHNAFEARIIDVAHRQLITYMFCGEVSNLMPGFKS